MAREYGDTKLYIRGHIVTREMRGKKSGDVVQKGKIVMYVHGSFERGAG